MNPRLEALLSEPIIRLLMQRDGVSADDVRALIKSAALGYTPKPNGRP
ncbi:MAG: hypothetical protein QM667_05990 [Asticcacaulis sp.]